MNDYHAYLSPGEFYHIYNRGNNKENLFVQEGNYHFFLSKWLKYLEPYLDVFAYCLMPNHFHFVVRVKDQACFDSVLAPEQTPNRFLELQFKKLFTSYALAFNKQQNRTGSLFQKRFKRVRIRSRHHLLGKIHYVNRNPIHHKFTRRIEQWRFTSYCATILPNNKMVVKRDSVLELFGGLEKFIRMHQKPVKNLVFPEPDLE